MALSALLLVVTAGVFVGALAAEPRPSVPILVVEVAIGVLVCVAVPTMRAWRCVALATLAVSLAGPLGADAATATRWSLLALHTSMAATLLAAMTPRSGCIRPSRPPVST